MYISNIIVALIATYRVRWSCMCESNFFSSSTSPYKFLDLQHKGVIKVCNSLLANR